MSEGFDRAAARLLRRAYAAEGAWVSTWIPGPTPEWWAWALRRGINLAGRDRWGQVRWVRGMIRSVYYLHKWHYYETGGLQLGTRRLAPNRAKAIRYETGRRGPLGYAFRIRVEQGGQRAQVAVHRKPATSYVLNPAVQSTIADRDW